MSDILLIHGAAHGAWCWHRVLPLLRAMGHNSTRYIHVVAEALKLAFADRGADRANAKK